MSTLPTREYCAGNSWTKESWRTTDAERVKEEYRNHEGGTTGFWQYRERRLGVELNKNPCKINIQAFLLTFVSDDWLDSY